MTGLLDHQIDELLLEARGLALVSGILRERGVDAEAIAAHKRELERTRARLVELIGTPQAHSV
jgi:hypothetical protein